MGILKNKGSYTFLDKNIIIFSLFRKKYGSNFILLLYVHLQNWLLWTSIFRKSSAETSKGK